MTTPNMPNLAAVEAMGKQFNSNVFEGLSKKAFKTSRRLAATAKPKLPPVNTSSSVTVTQGAATKNAPGNMLGAGSSKAPGGLGAGAGQRALPSGPTKAPAGGFATPHTPGATPHSNTGPNRLAIGSGRKPIATPFNGPSRVIPVSGAAPATRLPFSSPAQTQSPVNRTHFGAPTTPSFSGGSGNVIQGHVISSTTTPVHNSTQFADVTPKDNSPYPTHQHPAGSSNQILPHLTASQSTPERPNQFTVGSRNIKGSGIAAMGSQLEAGLSARPIGLPPKKRRV